LWVIIAFLLPIFKINMQQKSPVSVLVAPLDWGLGHATRCITIIQELLDQEAQVIIAASGPQRYLLQEVFPGLECLEIPGYQIRYNSGVFFKWGIFLRIPRLLNRIKEENRWLARLLEIRSFDAVISDNRYGLHNQKLISVFVTHQLYIQSGFSEGINRLLLKWHNRLIRKFSVCWIPDQDNGYSISGLLCHPPVAPSIPLKYIGLLSRFKPLRKHLIPNTVLILISGPEPQRSNFEKIVLKQLQASTVKATLVRGLPGNDSSLMTMPKDARVYNHLPPGQLNELISESEFIITRSGYSSIMDLLRLKRNAILVPTPGQTEQEYLGKYLNEKNWMCTVNENTFNLPAALKLYTQRKFSMPEIADSLLSATVTGFLDKLAEQKHPRHLHSIS